MTDYNSEMNDQYERSSGLRVSLRELLLLLGFFALACAALKYANGWWEAAISAVALLLFMASVVIALVDRGRRQAVAIGFAVFMGSYGLMGWIREGDLPTDLPLAALYRAIATQTYVDVMTQEVVPGNEFSVYSQNVVGMNVSPDSSAFLRIGHVLWALLLGYVGSRLAAWVYSRREGT
jgi:hypothetical protein